MEFAQQLFSMLDDGARERIVYKPSRGLKGRVMRRILPLGEDDGKAGQQFSDIEFVVGDERVSFYGIRVIFGTLSRWFEQRLYGDDACGPQLELPQVHPDAFRCIFNVAYGINPMIDITNVMIVLDAAQKTGVDFLAGECLGLLAQNITAENVLSIFNAALEQDILTPAFERQCCKVILKKSKQVMDSPAFLGINVELMAKLVECDFFFVNEIELWRRLVLWAKSKAAMDMEMKDDTPTGEEDDYSVGDRVILVNGNVGTIRYKGEVEFGPGCWFGIELRDAKGDTRGTVDDREYFSIEDENKGGTFVRVTKIGAKVSAPEVGDDWIPDCKCGQTLTQMPARDCYNGGNVNCDVCGNALGQEDEVVFHCTQGRIEQHQGGYDMCENCVNTKREEARSTESKEAELLGPTSRDVQYLRQVIPYVRFPTMPPDFFINKIAPLLPRPMADSVLIHRIVPSRACIFPTTTRMNWNATSADNRIEFTVVAASCELEKARNIPNEGVQAEWSRQQMASQGNRQWFVCDTAQSAQLLKLDMKNYYGDGDTVKDVTVYALDPSVEWDGSQGGDGAHWLEQCSFESRKTSSWQNNIGLNTMTTSRYWRFVVTAVWGGEGNYTCWDHLKLYGTKDDDADDGADLQPRLMETTYTVPAASHALDRAQRLATRDIDAEWSRIKMEDSGGPQWFVADLGTASTIKKMEIKHRYSDNDTIKDMEVYYLPTDVEFGSDQRVDQGGAWVKACDILSRQSTDVQTLDCAIDPNILARYWKFRVTSLYGGGPTCGNYPCMNYMVLSVMQPMWTTGLSQEEEVMV